jgi:hypothetical protein
MGIGEGGMHGEVAANEKPHAGNGISVALVEDMPRVVEASAVGTSRIIRGGGAVAKGVVPLE